MFPIPVSYNQEPLNPNLRIHNVLVRSPTTNNRPPDLATRPLRRNGIDTLPVRRVHLPLTQVRPPLVLPGPRPDHKVPSPIPTSRRRAMRRRALRPTGSEVGPCSLVFLAEWAIPARTGRPKNDSLAAVVLYRIPHSLSSLSSSQHPQLTHHPPLSHVFVAPITAWHLSRVHSPPHFLVPYTSCCLSPS